MRKRLRHLFVPHHSNNFRARVLHFDYFALYIIIFFLLALTLHIGHKINPDILGFATDIHVEDLLSLTNHKRAELQKTPLILNEQLTRAAQQKAQHMFTHNYWSHTAPDGTTPWDFINGAGYVYSVAGENLAKNFSTSQEVVEAWMNSATHKDNILRDQYQEIGFAVVDGILNGDETTLVVQMFGNRLASTTIASQNKEESMPIPAFVAEAETEPVTETQYVGMSEEKAENTAALIEAGNSPDGVNFDNVVKKPFIDVGKLAKQYSLGLSSLLVIILFIDGIYIWRKKVIRVSGKNSAHIIFILIITGLVWVMSFGSIL